MAFTMTVAELIDADTSGMLGKHLTWERVPLAEVATILNGAPFDSALFSTTEGTPLIRIRDVTTGKTNTYYKGTYEDTFLIKQGDLLVGMDGDFNSGHWGPKAALLNQRVCKISPTESFYDKRLLSLALPGYLSAINANTPSVTVKHLSSKTIGEIGLPLPPRVEQTRIAEKLEELLSDLDAGVAELKAAQKKLGQYRQSLLKAAVEGALTAEWRAARAPLPPGGGGAGGEGVTTLATEDEPWFQARARELRQQQTPQEQALWQQLRAKRFSGYKFRRQHVLGRFIVDFVCFAQRLIVELDGGQHAEAVDYDKNRDTWLEQQGFRVLRFWNNEWATQSEAVLEAIWQALQHPPPLPNPSPARGEGLKPETGAQLLARILLERRARWEAKQLAKFAEQGKVPPKDWQKKYPEPVQPDTSDLPELPEGWVWASVDQVAEIFLGKMLDKTKHTSGTKMPYLRNVNVRWGSIETHDVSEMFFDNYELDRYGLFAGDVLVCEGGEPGRSAICKKEHESLKYQKALHRVRLFDFYEPELLVAFLEFVAKTGRLEKTFTGSTINHFTKESFLTLQIPLAPLCEQRAIVESLLLATSIVDEQKAALEVSFKQSAAQRKNILKAAFSGQLVPQDPNDEPASVLLERIRTERAERDALKKPRGRKTKEAV